MAAFLGCSKSQTELQIATLQLVLGRASTTLHGLPRGLFGLSP